MKAAGGEPHRLAELPVSATRANWSAKNRSIAFTGISKAGTSSIWIVDSDGRNPREQKADALSNSVFYPSWYPDGEELAVMDGRDLVIKRIDLARNIVTALTDHNQLLTGMPSVSPDGKWIAFAGQPNKGQAYDQTKNYVWLLNLGDGVVRPLERTPQQGRAPTWSPDGTRVAFESNRDNLLGRYAVFVADRDGRRIQRITDFSLNANHPVWSPDGRQLAFSAHAGSFSTGSHIAIVGLPAPR